MSLLSQSLPRRTTTSPYLRPFFIHLLPLLYLGSRRPLTLDDLESVPSHLLSSAAMAKMNAALIKGDRKSKWFLLKVTFGAFGRDLLKPIAARVVLLLATFGQVFLVHDMTDFIADSNQRDSRGWALIGGFVLIYTIIPVSTYLYWEAVFNVSVQYRSALVGSIYTKTLRLASTRSIGQGAASTYMSVDVERITESLGVINEVWAAVASIGLACALLWFQAGYAMFSPLVVVVLILGVASLFAGPAGRSQKILPIKLGAYEKIFIAKVTKLRNQEINVLKRFFIILTGAATVSNMGVSFGGLACLGTYYILHINGVRNSEGPLDVTRIFTILTILNLLDSPINTIGQSLPSIAAAFASMQRISGFLVMPEKEGTQLVEKTVCTLTVVVEPSDKLELEEAHREAVPDKIGLSIKNGSFGWEEGTPVLHDIEFELAPGVLTMLVGPVASGKSTLLMSMMGESVKLSGEVTPLTGRVAYASQTPFIFPGDVRSNIIFDRPYDPVRLAKVIQACALTQDIERMPDGQATMLGERGVSLSGGQRQRVALARAVYSNAGLVLLDDTFSALDGETEEHVHRSLFGPSGMLKGKTVVLITHGIGHLSYADRLLILDKGRIVQHGSATEILADQDAISPVGRIALIRQITSENKADVVEEKAEASVPVDEEAESEKANWRAYLFYFRSQGWFNSMTTMILIALSSAVQVGIQGFLTKFAATTENRPAWFAGYAAICLTGAFTLVIALLHMGQVSVPIGGRAIHLTELDGVMSSPFSYLQSTPAGKIINRFSQDIQANDFTLPLALLNFVALVVLCSGSLIFFFLATPWLALSIPILAPVYFFTIKFYLATSKQLQHLEAGSKSPLYTLFGTTLAGLTTIRAYKAEHFFSQQNTLTLDRSQGPFFFRFEGRNYLRVVLTWVTTILAISMGIISVALRHKTSAALLGVALSQLTNLGELLSFALTGYAQVENSGVSIKRIQEFAELPREETFAETQALKLHIDPKKPWPTVGSIEFKDYSMRYKEELPPALKNLSFSLQGGLKIGICGRSGSGKSSMLLALFRATKFATGSILVDGVDVFRRPLEELRGAMCIVTQDPFLWHDTLRGNLDVESICTDEEIWTALEDVGMKVAVSELPTGLEEVIGDEDSFSKGQRQLLCLARALLSKKKIIVLDESTSSMDRVSDEKIRRVVETKMQGRTVLAIAHRISSIVHYDRILLLDDGEIMEYGPPEDLLSDPESRFSKLAATQGIGSKDLK